MNAVVIASNETIGNSGPRHTESNTYLSVFISPELDVRDHHEYIGLLTLDGLVDQLCAKM